MIDTVFGPPLFPPIDSNDIVTLEASAIRSSIQYHTLQGYISENRIIEYLIQLPDINNVKKIPDYTKGHGGDVEFYYKNQRYTMEIKTMTVKDNKKGTLSITPTRKSDIVHAYRRGDFQLVGINITNRSIPPLFVHTDKIPAHKRDDTFLATCMTLNESKHYIPFTHDLISLL